jgi:ubiquinone/menaquinone biosynthesis C-methylase UbiE
MSITAIEELDADRLIAEMIRVTKPGGRVAVIARSVDLPFMMNAPMDAELKSKVNVPGIIGTVMPRGCADVSLYERLHRAGLTHLTTYPAAATFDTSEPEWLRFMDDAVVRRLSPEEVSRWRAARARAEATNTFFMAFPHHCAIGTKV